LNPLNKEIKESLFQQGAALVGFADLSDLPEAIRDGYPYGISIAVELNPEIVKIIGNGPSIEYYDEYRKKNDFLNQLANNCSEFLKTKGFNALAKTQQIVISDEKTKRTKLPHKTVATKAGLGWIGKCALLITPEYGSAIRITSVLTNANLDVATPVIGSKCGECVECENICPAGAVTGKQWVPGIDRDEFYHALDCRDKIRERGVKFGLSEGTCGLCFWVCPWTQKHLQKSSTKV
jgi:epoxyqueuosine reductase QueG